MSVIEIKRAGVHVQTSAWLTWAPSDRAVWDRNGHVVLALLIVAVSRKILFGGDLSRFWKQAKVGIQFPASEHAAESVLSVAE